MYAGSGLGAVPFPTIASWKNHVAISGGAVTRMPSAANGAKKGELAARYGGAGTRYPTMAVQYVPADANIRALDNAERAKDDTTVSTQAEKDIDAAAQPNPLGDLASAAKWIAVALGAYLLLGVTKK